MNLLDDPKNLSLMSLGLRLMSTPGKFGPALGQAGLGAMGDMQQAKAAQQAQQTKALQQRMLEMQMEQIQREQARRSKDQGVMSQFLAPQAGPTMDGGPVKPNIDPLMMLQAGLSMDSLPQVAQLQGMVNPPKQKPVISKPGDIARGEDGDILWQNEVPPDMTQMLIPDGKGGFMPNPAWVAAKKATQAPQTVVNVGLGQTLTPAQKKVDETFATEYADYVAAGGVADTVKQLGQLRGVLGMLKKDDSLTGPVRGQLPESIRSITNPDAVAARNAVEEVVQRNLRLILGAQFTEKEGERLIARAYNPLLRPEENARRVERLIQQIQGAAAAKIDAARYYEANGTLQGWVGKLPTLRDIEGGLQEQSVRRYNPDTGKIE